LLEFADTGISNLGQISKNFFSSLSPGNVGNFFCEKPRLIICQKWSRFKPICYFIKTHKFADTSISTLGQILKNFFSSLSQGNVGDLSCEQPRPIICQKWSRFKPICYFIKTHKFADTGISNLGQILKNFVSSLSP
jgi:hypothetical protein